MRVDLGAEGAGQLPNRSHKEGGAPPGLLPLDCSLVACAAGAGGRAGELAVAVCLGGVLLLGGLGNLSVGLIFAKFPAVRTPLNLLLLNLSLSDLLRCVSGTSFSFASRLGARGLFLRGRGGRCRWDGLANALFGIVSLVSLSVLSYERYLMVLRKPGKSMTSSYTKSFLCIGATWLYALLWTLPLLFGWSSDGPGDPGEGCSVVAWFTRTPSNLSYVACLFVFCLILPLVAMTYCYGRILQIIRRQVSRFPVTAVQRREQRILCMVVTMVTCYSFCWMPYGVVALVATFGKPGTVTPAVGIVSSILAKASTVANPILYVLLNKQFYRCFAALLKCDPHPIRLEMAWHSKWSRNSNPESREAPVCLLGVQRRPGSTKVRPNPVRRNPECLPFGTASSSPRAHSMSSSKNEPAPLTTLETKSSKAERLKREGAIFPQM